MKYNLNFYDRCNIIIYRVESKNIANYYYIIKIKGRISKVNLVYKNQKLELNVDLFGQETSVEVEMSQIEVA